MPKGLLSKLSYRPLRLRLYGRLMVCYILIFLIVAYIFTFIAATYYSKYQTFTQLQKSMNALNALSGYYESKQNEFANNICPLYQSENYNDFLTMLDSKPDVYLKDALNKQRIVEILQTVAEQDSDIEAVLIQKKPENINYVYLRKAKTLNAVSQYPFMDEMSRQELGRIILGAREIEISSAVSNYCYGIGGIIGLGISTDIKAKFLVLYNANAFNNVIEGYEGTQGRYLLCSLEGDVIYDSQGGYYGEKLPYIDTLLSGKDSVVIDEEWYYLQTVKGKKSNFVGVNIVPQDIFAQQSKQIKLVAFGIVTLLALICIALFTLGGNLISRRVKMIEKAIKMVGSNDLSYRIPIVGRPDEFGEIAIKFNQMCDKLQNMIDLVYVTEIKKKTAELSALQSGVNPHFLYNTLEAIRVMALESGNDNVAEMIVNLSNIYRSMVKNHTFIPIRNEIKICELFIDFFALRYESSLEYEMNIDRDILGFCILRNLLQPIIENYFVHGIREDREVNRFHVRGFRRGDDICFVFRDNGRGIGTESLAEIRQKLKTVTPETNSGYGFLNVQERIRLAYGEAYGITIESKENVETCITIAIKAMTCKELESRL